MTFDKKNPKSEQCGDCVRWPECEKLFIEKSWKKGGDNYERHEKTFCGWSPSRFKKPDAWDLFWEMFKEGEEVCVITDDDVLLTGKLYTTERHCILNEGSLREKIIDWDDVRFISHDGFPFRKLLGADGSKSIEDIDTTDTCAKIREKTSSSSDDEERGCYAPLRESRGESGKSSNGKRNRNIPGPDTRCHTDGLNFGDPWRIENVTAELFNPGQLWSEENWLHEETLYLTAKDGAGALLFDIPTIYHFEIGQRS